MKRAVLTIVIFLIIAGAGGGLVAWLGLVPIAASPGHWAITDWLLHGTMRQSVETQSSGIEVPPLDDPALARRAAGHYATGCAPCHGTPDSVPSLVTQWMTPHPPYLLSRIGQWQAEELFWIVKHGVKFTAMPAWPAQSRDDEVWAMTAFLQQLPDMAPETYQELAYGPTGRSVPAGERTRLGTRASGMEASLADCARCHGRNGAGRGPGAVPILAGQTTAYLRASLQAYADHGRYSGIMQPVATGLSEATLQALAEHFAAQPAPARRPAALDPDAIRRGGVIAQGGIPEQGVPACVSCHGPKAGPRDPRYPRLTGQYADYLELQLRLFQQEDRGGTAYAHLMNTIAGRLTEDQMRDVAQYYASLASAR